MIKIEKHDEFNEWFDSLTEKEQDQVDKRLEKIEKEEHFGDAKNIGESLVELRWKNGWRVYFTKVIGKKIIILLLGGHKNAQKKEISKARLLLGRYRRN